MIHNMVVNVISLESVNEIIVNEGQNGNDWVPSLDTTQQEPHSVGVVQNRHTEKKEVCPKCCRKIGDSSSIDKC